MLLGNLAMNLLGNVLNSVAAQKNYAFNQSQHMIFARKIQEMDYDRLEEERTHMPRRPAARWSSGSSGWSGRLSMTEKISRK